MKEFGKHVEYLYAIVSTANDVTLVIRVYEDWEAAQLYLQHYRYLVPGAEVHIQLTELWRL